MSTEAIQRIPAAFGKLLQQRRVERGYEPAGFVAAVGLGGEDALRRLETGEDEPTLTQLFRIASALGEAPAFLFIDLIAAWRDGPVRDLLYQSRPSDFPRLYRLGRYSNAVEYRELPHAYDFMNDAIHAARVLNAKRRSRREGLVDHVSIFVRLGYIRFAPPQTRTNSKADERRRGRTCLAGQPFSNLQRLWVNSIQTRPTTS